jgi:beta-galactosidase
MMHAHWQSQSDASWQYALDGLWAFRLVTNPNSCPRGFEKRAFDDSGWTRIPVPANWEIHGHGEPLYCNKAYPFPADPPCSPKENPTGCYRTSFAIPSEWNGRHVFVEFGSVDSALQLWVNGMLIGWSTDSKLPASFNITHALVPGQNILAAKVVRWAASSYLEKQDYWHLSGIQRSVRLIAKPPVHLRDWAVQTRFDPRFRDATVRVRAWMNRPPGPAGKIHGGEVCFPSAQNWRIAMTLLDPAGRKVASATVAVATRSPFYGEGDPALHEEAFSAAVDLTVPQAKAWTAETPHLYTLLLELIKPTGEVVDEETTRVGIRQVEIADGILRVNGKRLVIRGVNRHEFHPRRGRALTRADMREDLLAMKRLNFNAVRTSHYPNADAWYDLCDELGMYVVDEANLETHGCEALLSRDPVWAHAYLERAIRMVLRDRNHPCIVAWSLGNESHCGPNHAAMANWIRMTDPTRPVQYENGRPSPLISDIMAPMYPTIDWIKRYLSDPSDRRPLILCEYAYAKGNSTGNFGKYWDLIHKHPRFQGGFVWDWRDKALESDDPSSINGLRWRYGAECGEPEGTTRMCLNGVVGPDLVPHPGAWEIKHHQAPVRAVKCTRGSVIIENRYQFLTLDHLRCRWSVEADGIVLKSGSCRLPTIGPGGRGTLRLDLPRQHGPPGSERFLNLRFVLARDTAWATRGHEVGAQQFALGREPEVTPPARKRNGQQALQLDSSPTGHRIAGAGWSVLFDKAAGALSEIAVSGKNILCRALIPTVMRAPTDIDIGVDHLGHLAQWSTSGLDQLVWEPGSVTMDRRGASMSRIRIEGRLFGTDAHVRADVRQTWIVRADGELAGNFQFNVAARVDSLPRIGLVCSLHSAQRELRWFGRGPHENYPDRCDSAFVGAYRAPVHDLLTPYVFPQECGLRCDVRHGAVVGADGGLAFSGEPTLHVSALPVNTTDLTTSKNLADLRLRDETELHLDGFHMGLGGDTGWYRNVHPEYLLPPGIYRFRLRLRPLVNPNTYP